MRGERDGFMQQQRGERRPDRHSDKDSRDRDRPPHRDGSGYGDRGGRSYSGDEWTAREQGMHYSQQSGSMPGSMPASRHSSSHNGFGEAVEDSVARSRQQQGGSSATFDPALRGRKDGPNPNPPIPGGSDMGGAAGAGLLKVSKGFPSSIAPPQTSAPPPEAKPAIKAEEAPLIRVVSKDANKEMSEKERVKSQKVFASGSKERDRGSKEKREVAPTVAALTPTAASLKLPTANPFSEFHPSPPMTDSTAAPAATPPVSSSSSGDTNPAPDTPVPVAGKRVRAAWGQGLAAKQVPDPEPDSEVAAKEAPAEPAAVEAELPPPAGATPPPMEAVMVAEAATLDETPKKRSRDPEVLSPSPSKESGSRSSPRSISKQKKAKQEDAPATQIPAEDANDVGAAKPSAESENPVAEAAAEMESHEFKPSEDSPRADTSSSKKRNRTPTAERRTEADTPSAATTAAGSNSAHRGRPFGSANRPKMQRLESRKRERALLSHVFSSYGDLAKAFNTIKAMIDMQQGIFLSNIEAVAVIPASVGRVPLPLLSEISFSLDFIETQSDYLVENMLAVKSRQVILENMLSKQQEGALTAGELSPASFLPFPDMLTLTNYAGYAVSVPLPALSSDDALVSSGAADMQQTHSQQQQGTVAPVNSASAALLSSIQEQNKIRIVEAHLFAATVNQAGPEIAVTAISNSEAAPSAPKLSTTDLIKAAIMPFAPSAPPQAPDESDTFKRVKAKMLSTRASTIPEIRRRKLAKRDAWEELANRYMWQHQRWAKHLEPIEKRQEMLDAEQPREAFTLGQPLHAGRQTSNSASATGFGHGLASSRSGDRIRSEYDQERLLKQLEHNEALNLRITKGAATVVSQLLPWQHFDKTKVPPPPHWPDHLTEFTAPTGETLSNVYHGSRFPQFVPTIIDTVDTNLHRLTTDGCRQYCASLPLDVECPIGCNCAREVDRQSRYERVWTDIEKSIFLDKFLQFPKNFSKIASYLVNRSTQDCVEFYYDSKAAISYKALLRELDNRRRQIRHNWQFSVPAANSVGCNLYPTGHLEATADPLVELPLDDSTFNSFLNHPPYTGEKLEVEPPQSRCAKLMTYPLPDALHATLLRVQRRIDKFLSSAKSNKQQLTQPSCLGDYLFDNVHDNCPNIGEPSLIAAHRDSRQRTYAATMALHTSSHLDPRATYTSTPSGKSGQGGPKAGSASKGNGSSLNNAGGKASGNAAKKSGGSSKPGIAEAFPVEMNAAGKPRQRRRRRTPEEREREKELKQIRNATRQNTPASTSKTDDCTTTITGSDGGDAGKKDTDNAKSSDLERDSDAFEDEPDEAVSDEAEQVAGSSEEGAGVAMDVGAAMDVEVFVAPLQDAEAPADPQV